MKKKFQKITFHTLLFKQMAIFQGIYVYIYIIISWLCGNIITDVIRIFFSQNDLNPYNLFDVSKGVHSPISF